MKRSRLAAVPLGLPLGLFGLVATGAPAQAADQPDPVDATGVAAPAVWRPVPGRLSQDRAELVGEDLLDIPEQALAAYQRAEVVLAEALPTCHLDAALLAGIGKVETDHGRYGAWKLGPRARMFPDLVGAPVDRRSRPQPDSDGGTWDHDPNADLPLGPLQIEPSAWQETAVDGDGDGIRSPFDLDDAALSLGVLLCADGADLADPTARDATLRALNDRPAFVNAVEAYRTAYAAPVELPPIVIDALGTIVVPPPLEVPDATAPTKAPKPTKPAATAVPAAPASAPPVVPSPASPSAPPSAPPSTPPSTPPATPTPVPDPTPADPTPAPTPDPTPSTSSDPSPSADPTADPATALTSAAPGDALVSAAP
jgi:hypothetical protein